MLAVLAVSVMLLFVVPAGIYWVAAMVKLGVDNKSFFARADARRRAARAVPPARVTEPVPVPNPAPAAH